MSENPSKHLDLSARLGKCRERVYRVGVELEGGWLQLPPGLDHLDRDGSVVFPSAQVMDLNGKIKLKVGEIPSPVLIPSSTKDNVLTLEKWMRVFYPSHVNHTCGMHVHMSFQNAFQYQQLMREDFMWTVLHYFNEWAKERVRDKSIPASHCFFERLAGKSEYCQHVFHADEQAVRSDKRYGHFEPGHRYTVIHYPFQRIGTVECRLLPMFATVDLALNAIRYLLSITSAFLVEVAAKDSLMIDGKLAGRGEKGVSAEWVRDGSDQVHQESVSLSA